MSNDSIAAIATPPGRGGVGIIRISGSHAKPCAEAIAKLTPTDRYAHFSSFYDQEQVIDQGILIFFPGPHSFTGEDVCEFHCHGGPVILDQLLSVITQQGVRLARPGEFSERAFLNDKIDLAQAEAIADLIDATSQQAARKAMASLQGVFSQHIHELVSQLTALRLYVEAAIDFPEEEIDFLQDAHIKNQLAVITNELNAVQASAKQGVIIREGMNVVIAGLPNSGKSSLLNRLAGEDRAIVTDIAGTTRDSLQIDIHIDGIDLHIIDTAGIRETDDPVEKIGVARAKEAIKTADQVLVMVDSTRPETFDWQPLLAGLSVDTTKVTIIANKTDLAKPPELTPMPLPLSAKTGLGIDALKARLKAVAGFDSQQEHNFTARRRHLDAIESAQVFLQQAKTQLGLGAGELMAQDLLEAQKALGEITGKVSADDLLGKIFSSFCIGK